MVQLFKKYQLDILYAPGFPYMHQCFFVLEKLINDHMPKLYQHMVREKECSRSCKSFSINSQTPKGKRRHQANAFRSEMVPDPIHL